LPDSVDNRGIGDGIIDAHVHTFPPELVRDRTAFLARDTWFATLYASPRAAMVTAEEVIAAMDAGGVARSVVFGFAFRDQGLCGLVNDYVLEAVATYPDRLAGLCCVSPQEPGAVAELERCLDAGMKGCGELAPDGQGLTAEWAGGGGARRPAARAGLGQVAACLTERGLPLLMHSNEAVGHDYAGKGGFTLEHCLALATAYPDLNIVLAHMGGGLFVYELMPEVRRTLSRVYYDTAAVPYLYDPEVYRVAVSCAGPHKIIFGSDFPLLPVGRYQEGLSLLDETTRAAVTGGNARKVFRL